MADVIEAGKELVNARFSVRVKSVPADKVPTLMAEIKAILAEWGEPEVVANLSYPRKPLTLADAQQNRL